MRSLRLAAIAALVVLAAAACTGKHDTAHHSTSAKPAAASASATPTHSPSAAPILKLGQAATANRSDSGTWTAAVTDWQAHVDNGGREMPEPNEHLAAVKVKVCHTTAGSSTDPTASQVGWGAWSLRGSDDSVTYANWSGEFMAGQYPVGYSVPVGQCVAGWIPFPTADTTTVTSVSYSPTTSGSADAPRITAGTWAVA